MPGYTKSDAAKDTGSSIKEVSGAWHEARGEVKESGGFEKGADRSSVDRGPMNELESQHGLNSGGGSGK